MSLEKNLLLSLLLSLYFLALPNHSKANITLDLKKNFYAVGNGKKDDTKAFELAANYINTLNKPCTLFIPQGVYRVGKQIPRNPNSKLPLNSSHVFHLKQANQVTIIGIKNKSKIVYNDNLYYGTFDLSGNPIPETSIKRPYIDMKHANPLGCLIKLESCNKITIKNIELNGNMYEGKMNIGGGYGDKGTQLEHYGIHVLNSNQVKIQDCIITRFGLDGIYLWNNKPNQPSENMVIENCASTYNGRQALSICSGQNIVVKKCTLSHTGKGIISSAPCAGIDIEPESVFGNAFLSNTLIQDCFIHNNVGVGVLFSQYQASENTTVLRSTIIGNTNMAIWTQQKSVTYESCKIYGSAVHNYPAKSASDGDATRYINCSFSDTLNAPNKPYANPIYIHNGYLISASTSDYVRYENCRFTTKQAKVLWLSVANAANHYYFSNCYLNTSSSVNDAIWIPNANIEKSSFKFPPKTLHLGLNYNSGKSKIDAKTLINARE